ncbi:unnamed protein product [Spirodela intermedia]|uniref:LOB domain-containing protein n=1 Tax=Spirodela intermedia TaxID=51605 RepID=A0A7I8IYX7_SPIIN|nr:unnamed protein product [Spirodela intermedia]CAA6662343.1 unnamed protein product [Spirodela intermedia]
MSNSTRCAACRYLRRRCTEDCVLAPYFPSTHPDRFACVHRIFGASNVCRMLQLVPVEQRGQAADSIAYEAYWRMRDPVYGCVGSSRGCSRRYRRPRGSSPRPGPWWP